LSALFRVRANFSKRGVPRRMDYLGHNRGVLSMLFRMSSDLFRNSQFLLGIFVDVTV
jgi:hypothetical protein